MTLKLESMPVPLREYEPGCLRVGNTRVSLESVLYAYLRGESAEGIVDSFPTLRLADAYAVIAYYLDHRDECDAYLRDQEIRAEALRREIESRFDQKGFKDRLLTRKRQLEAERLKRLDEGVKALKQ